MARTLASLPTGARITDHISLGVLTKTFPLDKVKAAVAAADKTSQRQRDLPAHVVMYYVMALTLYRACPNYDLTNIYVPQVDFLDVSSHVANGTKWKFV